MSQRSSSILSLNSILYIVFVVFIMILYIIPQFKNTITYDTLSLLSFAYYLMFFLNDGRALKRFFKFFLLALPYALIMFFVARPMDFKYGFVHPLMTLWVLVFPLLITINTYERNVKIEKMFILITSFIAIFITCYITFVVLGDNLRAIRDVANSLDSDLAGDLTERGVGGFGIAYSTGAIVVASLIVYRGIKKGTLRWIVLAIGAYFGVFVLKADFTTLIIITFLSILFCYYLTAQKKSSRFLLVVISLVIIFTFPILIKFLITAFSGSDVGGKFAMMDRALFGGGEIKQISGDRSELQYEAFLLFLQSPIWGNSITDTTNLLIVNDSHSEVLREAATTGIIGLASFFYCFIYYIKELMKVLGPIGKSLKPVIFYFLLFVFTNPIFGFRESMWILFVMIPLFIHESLTSSHATNFNQTVIN